MVLAGIIRQGGLQLAAELTSGRDFFSASWRTSLGRLEPLANWGVFVCPDGGEGSFEGVLSRCSAVQVCL
jgi:hypothetical protein